MYIYRNVDRCLHVHLCKSKVTSARKLFCHIILGMIFLFERKLYLRFCVFDELENFKINGIIIDITTYHKL